MAAGSCFFPSLHPLLASPWVSAASFRAPSLSCRLCCFAAPLPRFPRARFAMPESALLSLCSCSCDARAATPSNSCFSYYAPCPPGAPPASSAVAHRAPSRFSCTPASTISPVVLRPPCAVRRYQGKGPSMRRSRGAAVRTRFLHSCAGSKGSGPARHPLTMFLLQT